MRSNRIEHAIQEEEKDKEAWSNKYKKYKLEMNVTKLIIFK